MHGTFSFGVKDATALKLVREDPQILTRNQKGKTSMACVRQTSKRKFCPVSDQWITTCRCALVEKRREEKRREEKRREEKRREEKRREEKKEEKSSVLLPCCMRLNRITFV